MQRAAARGGRRRALLYRLRPDELRATMNALLPPGPPLNGDLPPWELPRRRALPPKRLPAEQPPPPLCPPPGPPLHGDLPHGVVRGDRAGHTVRVCFSLLQRRGWNGPLPIAGRGRKRWCWTCCEGTGCGGSNDLCTAPAPDNTYTAPPPRRYPTAPIAQLSRHHGFVNALAWAPHSSCHICTVGNDAQARGARADAAFAPALQVPRAPLRRHWLGCAPAPLLPPTQNTETHNT